MRKVKHSRLVADDEEFFPAPDEEIVEEEEVVEDIPEADGEPEVDVDPDAAELLFDASDVADLVAEVTGEDVTVAVDTEGDEVVFTVADTDYTVTPDEDVELVSSVKMPRRRPVSASAMAARRRAMARRSTMAARRPAARPATRRPAARRMPVQSSAAIRRPAVKTGKTIKTVSRPTTKKTSK